MAESISTDEYRAMVKPHKYHARRVVLAGIRFDSQAEATRYDELQLLERAGQIVDLQTQPNYVLQEGFTDRAGRRVRKIEYRADFAYTEAGQLVAEDVKGFEPAIWKLKQKLFLCKFPGIELRIIRPSRASRASRAPQPPKA